LLEDHRRLELLFEELLSAFEENDREGVATTWSEFDRRLLAHMNAEERYLIPSLFRVDPRAARTILEEHRHLRARLTELGAGVDLHVVRLEAARGFVDELRAHARNEDRLLYRWADEHVAEADRKSLLKELFGAVSERVRAEHRHASQR
jgi:hemerythrin superfamily protein